MINVELNIKHTNHILITLDKYGRDALLAELSHLLDHDNHVHLFCPSWSTPEAAELSENIYSGEDYHWCHELSIGTRSGDITIEEKEHIDLFIDLRMSNKEYSAVQVSLVRTQAQLKELMYELTLLSTEESNFSLNLYSQVEINSNRIMPTKTSVTIRLF